MISLAGWWTQTPSATPLQPKKWNPHFWILFNFLWSGRLVNGLEPHLPPLSSQKSEMLIFVLQSTSDLGQTGQWTQNPSTTHHQPIKWNACFCITLNVWWLAGLSDGLKPHPPPLFSQKMKSSFLDYVQLLMISQAVWWTQTQSATPLQPKKWNAHFWILFNFWWSAWLVNGLEPHLPTLSSQKSEMLIFLLQSTSDLGQTGQWTQTPSTTNLQPIKWNACFWITLSVWWLAGLVDWLKPHLPPLFSQKMKSSFLDYVQLLMISWAGQWTRTPSANPLQPKKWNAYFCITINFWFRPDWSMDSNPIHHPSPTNKMKCLFLDYAQRLMIGWAGWRTQTPSTTPLQSKNEILIFGLCSTSDDQPGWSMDSKLICHPSPANKMKCSFLDYVHFGWSARLVNGLKPHPPPLSTQ